MKKYFYMMLLLTVTSVVSSKDYYDDANLVSPLLPGMTIPEFNGITPEGKTINFDPSNLDKPFVLTFYRGGWCPYCNAHLGEMREAEKQLVDLGFDVFFASPDQPSYLIESLKDKRAEKDHFLPINLRCQYGNFKSIQNCFQS